MANVKKTVTVTTVEFMVVDKANEAVKKVSTRFPHKVKVSKRLIKHLTEQTEAQGLHFVEITSIKTEPKRYEMPIEMFVTMAKEID